MAVERQDEPWTCTVYIFDGKTFEEVARLEGLGTMYMWAMISVDVDIDGQDELIFATTEEDDGFIYCYKFG